MNEMQMWLLKHTCGGWKCQIQVEFKIQISNLKK